MKKILTLLLTNAVILFSANAQSFDLVPPKTGFTLDAELNGENDFYDFKVECTFVNNTTTDTEFVWEKEIVSIPEKWHSTVCDPKGCYGPENTAAAFSVPVKSTSSNGIYVGFIPSGVPGTAKLNLKIYPANKPELAKKYSFVVNVSNTLGVDNRKVVKAFTMYPNPCVDNIIVPSGAFANYQGQANVINVEGKIVKVVNLKGTNDVPVDISDLSTGLYRLQFNTEEGNNVSKPFLKK